MLSELLSSLLICYQKFLLENSGRRKAFSFIPISFNINKLWLVQILMKKGKLPPFFGQKWDENFKLNHCKLLILSDLY